MTHTKQILIVAKQMIADPKCWARGVRAQNNNGVCNPINPRATSWCAEGAIDGAGWRTGQYYNFHHHEAHRLLVGACKAVIDLHDQSCDGQPIHAVNDGLGHDAVMKAFDLAIADCD